jgi:hypothetical protein
MAKKKGFNTRHLRSKGSIFGMNQVYEQTYNSKKLSFCQHISIWGIYTVLLTPIAILALFFVSLIVG